MELFAGLYGENLIKPFSCVSVTASGQLVQGIDVRIFMTDATGRGVSFSVV